MTKYTVDFELDDRQEAALQELLPYWQKYISKEDGSRPFEHYTTADLFKTIMWIGSFNVIWNKIKREQFRQSLIGVDEFTDEDRLTIAERREKRQQAQKEGACE